MTRSFFKGLTIRAVIALILSLGFLFICLFNTNAAKGRREQAQYQKEYGELLLASEYRMLDTEVLKNFQDIRGVLSAYDETGKLLGYILDVDTQTTTGRIHTQMSISENGENLLNLRIIHDKEDSISMSKDEMEELLRQLKGSRIPIAVQQQTAIDVPYQMEYDPLLGLHDGVYYAEAKEAGKDGYLDYCEIEVRGGRIVRANWDGVNKTSQHSRSEDSINGDYKVSGKIWAEQAYRLCNRLVVVQDPMKLAMKSDGTTSIIDGVTMKISMFVDLVNECIDNSRSRLTKEQYLANKTASDDPDKKENDASETTADTTPETTLTSDQDGASALDVGNTPAETTAVTYTPTPTKVPSEIGVIGGEDGIVQGNSENILSESVDGIPLSEIRTFIDGIPTAESEVAATLGTVNLAYKFMREYLKWVG